MDIPLLKDIVAIFGLSIFVLLVCARLRIPTVVGLLLTGVLCGPHGLGLVNAVHEVEVLSEIGVVLLLFTIGLEFSLTKLQRVRKMAIVGGSLQVALTTLCTAIFVYALGLPFFQGVFWGFLVSLSSTAIILKLLQEKAQMETPHGQSILAILIFQDIAVVPMMLMTPFLGGANGIDIAALLLQLLQGLVVMAAVLFLAQWAVPKLLYQIARTRNDQLFILCVLFICMSVAWMTSSFGLSLALGSFLAGLIISESEYSDHAVGHILPFQQVFTSFFFVSIGMLLDVSFLMHHPLSVAATTLGVITLKALVLGAILLGMGYSLRTAVPVALGLCQVGEFAFILASNGANVGLIEGTRYQLFLAFSIITMSLAPLVMALSPLVLRRIQRMRLPKSIAQRPPEEEARKDTLQDHLVIIGFGVCGRNLAWAAKISGIPYNILEINPETVRSERKKGEPIYFGDATHHAVLHQVAIEKARIAVIAINDPVATRRMVEEIRSASPKVYIITRTRYLHEMTPIQELGANEIIPEEFETSIEIFTRVLKKYLIPEDDIHRFAAEVRSRGYKMLRTLYQPKATMSDLYLNTSDMEVGTYRLPPASPLVGLSMQESDLRKNYGVMVLMIRRDSKVISNPSPQTVLKADDTLVVFGSPEQQVVFSQACKG